MSDCISRQAAVELAMEYCPDDDGTVQCDGDIRGLLDELENLPPAQPERKMGAWMPYDTIPRYVICRCSACGTDILVPCINDKTIFNYCPNCGAKMEEKQYE